ncbi:MAG: hypothetical protein Q4P05_09275, partial [Actinomycetaceae bacterium]|nr:hypothetical protein [Actinomycetaceae bacterium]
MLDFNRSLGRRLRGVLALFLFPMLALMGSAGLAPVAHAETISPTLTDVVVSPSEPAAGTEVKMSL